jgi:hypothetical protein
MNLRFLSLLALAGTLSAGCQKSAYFAAAGGNFFPLQTGSRWIYQVAYPGASHTFLTERVEATNGSDEARVSSEYSGYVAVLPTDLQRAYRPEASQIQIRYEFTGDFITRTESVGAGRDTIDFKEQGFLPRNLRPGQEWSNSFSPAFFGLSIRQHHRTFVESGVVIVPAGAFANCIRIETETSYKAVGAGTEHYFVDWYAPNVGIVKTLVFEPREIIWPVVNSRVVKALLTKSALFRREIASVKLVSFTPPPVEQGSVSQNSSLIELQRRTVRVNRPDGNKPSGF